jgi:hypothetical protein
VPTALRPSTLALVALAVLAVASPWAFGAVAPAAVLVVSTLALAAAAAALLLTAVGAGAVAAELPLAPGLALLALVGLQLVPLPPALHERIARGSWEVWHPSDAAAAAVLGGGPRPISVDPDSTLRSLAWLFGLLVLVTFAASELATRRWTSWVVLAIAGNGLALAVFGIWARSHFGARLYGRFEVPTIAPFGPFVSKNHFAGYMAMAALLSLGLVVGWTTRRDRSGQGWSTEARAGAVVFAVVAAAGMALGALVSTSRGGAAALFAGVLVFAALTFGLSWSERLIAPAVVAAGVAGLLIGALPAQTQARLATASGTSFRIGVWQDTLRLAAGSPVAGIGLGGFHDAFTRVKQGYGQLRIEHAENDYLETLAETGVLGLGLAGAGIGLLFRRSGSALRSSPPLVRGLAVGGLSGLAALAVHSALDFNLRIPSNAALAAVLAAAAASAIGTRSRPVSPRVAWPAAALTLLLLAALYGLPAAPSAAARERVREAALSASSDALALRLERAETGLRQALVRRPGDAEAWFQLAAVRSAGGDTASAAALARYAMRLDPQRADLRARAEALIR